MGQEGHAVVCQAGCTRAALDPRWSRCDVHGHVWLRAPDRRYGRRAPLLGTTLDDRFDLAGVLGIGGFGTVYLGVERRLPRFVAVKLLQDQRAEQASVRRRFKAEARALASLSSDHIVRVLAAGAGFARVPGGQAAAAARRQLYLVTEHVAGRTLSRMLAEDGPVAPAVALDLTRQMLAGLAEAHAHGVIHRDLKPGNAIAAHDRLGALRVKVLDFGVAKLLGQTGPSTATGRVVGTARYMAPEQLVGGPIGPPTDLFALGAMLYELLEGRPLYDAPDQQALLALRLNGRPPEMPAHWSPGLQALVARATALDPEDRFETAAGMVGALDALRGDTGALVGPHARRPTQQGLPARVIPAETVAFVVRRPAPSAAETLARPAPVDVEAETQATETAAAAPAPTSEPTPDPDPTPTTERGDPFTRTTQLAPPRRRAAPVWAGAAAAAALLAVVFVGWPRSAPQGAEPPARATAAQVAVGPADLAAVSAPVDATAPDATPPDAVAADASAPDAVVTEARVPDTGPPDDAATDAPAPEALCRRETEAWRAARAAGAAPRALRRALHTCAACGDAPCADAWAHHQRCVRHGVKTENAIRATGGQGLTAARLKRIYRQARRCRYVCRGAPGSVGDWSRTCAAAERCATALAGVVAGNTPRAECRRRCAGTRSGRALCGLDAVARHP